MPLVQPPESRRTSLLAALGGRARRRTPPPATAPPAATAPPDSRRLPQTRSAPRHWVIEPRPPAAPERDLVPPEVPRPERPAAGPARPVKPMFTADLVQELNEEYADKPVVPAPRALDAVSRSRQARSRMTTVHDKIDLIGKRVLEVGCGDGMDTWTMAHLFDAEIHGVDIVERPAWATLSDERTHFHVTDIATQEAFPEGYFDRAVSFSVWEHMRLPVEALAGLHRILAPGGVAYILAMLHRSPVASHRYRELFFPWPHLLFTDDVIEEWYVRAGRGPNRPAWVNHMTWAQYELAFEELGYLVRAVRLTSRPFDEAFYRRFQEPLARYPRFDLATDGFVVILQKPPS